MAVPEQQRMRLFRYVFQIVLLEKKNGKFSILCNKSMCRLFVQSEQSEPRYTISN
jgi:hypothetical protein